MSQIGTFTRNDDGFVGRIRTLLLDTEVSIQPVDASSVENTPNHRIFAGGLEIGAAWDRSGDRAGAYLSVIIDDPVFPEPIRARLFASDANKGVWHLLWTRRSKRDDQS